VSPLPRGFPQYPPCPAHPSHFQKAEIVHFHGGRERRAGIGIARPVAALSHIEQKEEGILENIGKFKVAKACIYVKKPSDINQDALKKLMGETISFLKVKYG